MTHRTMPAALLLWIAALIALSACTTPYPPGPHSPDHGRIGRITRIVGTGLVRINNRVVSEGATMDSGDHIETVGDARATLALSRGGQVLFDADTDPILEWVSAAFCRLRILINIGSILVDTPCDTEAETGSGAVINTLGTVFHVAVSPHDTTLTVIEGKAAIRGSVGGRQIVPAGFQCRVLRGRPAPRPVPADGRNIIQWACALDRRLCGPGRNEVRRTRVPNLAGMHVEKAGAALGRAGLKLGRIHRAPAPSRNRIGFVFRQTPAPGTVLKHGGSVDVWVYQARILRPPTLPQEMRVQ